MKSLIKINQTMNNVIGDVVKFKFDYYNYTLIRPLEYQASHDDFDLTMSSEELQKEVERRTLESKKYIDDFNKRYNSGKCDMQKFHNMIIEGKIDSFSRIDKYPIIEIDLSQPDRNDKIDIIIG